MSWVREAVKKVEAQNHEILHQTVYGGYGTKTSVRQSNRHSLPPDAPLHANMAASTGGYLR